MHSDTEYIPPRDSDHVWKNTSRWRPVQLEILKAKFKDSELQGMLVFKDLTSVVYYDDISRILLPGIDVIQTTDENIIPREQRIFFRRLKQLNMFDLVAQDLLTNTGFEDNKLHFRMKPRLELLWNSHRIGSEADFGVFIDSSMGIKPEFLLIIEDKSEKASVYQSGECQLFGEMLVAAMSNFSNIRKDYKMFGMIIRGSTIRLYSAIFKRTYLSFIGNDKVPDCDINVSRYPSETRMALSLSNSKEREHVLKILTSIKKRN